MNPTLVVIAFVGCATSTPRNADCPDSPKTVSASVVGEAATQGQTAARGRGEPPEPISNEDISKSVLVADPQKQLKAGDKHAVEAFWQSVSSRGTPLIEPVADPPHQVLVTFLYRSDNAQKGGKDIKLTAAAEGTAIKL